MIPPFPGCCREFGRRGCCYAGLFALGAHPFLTLTPFIAMFERDHDRLAR